MAEISNSELIKVLPTREGYDRWAEIYDEEDNPLISLENRFFSELLGPVKGLRLLDVGGGTGRHAIPLAAAGATVTVVDFSEKMVEKAQKKSGVEEVKFIRQDFSRGLVFKSDSFDKIICCLVLEHIVDLKSLMSEFFRVCRNNGTVLITLMHPAMNLVGIHARFTDPSSGEKIGPKSFSYSISDYVTAGLISNLKLNILREYSVDEELIRVSERAKKYLGWPLLFIMSFSVVKAL